MKKLIFCLTSLLTTLITVQGMEKQELALKIQKAKKYNTKNPNITFIDNLIRVPSDPLGHIINFAYLSELSEEIIKNTVHHNINNDSYIMDLDLSDNSHILSIIEGVLNKKAFEHSIKYYMKLSRTCTHFNEILTPQTVGRLHKHYTLDQKNEFWEELMTDIKYHSQISFKRIPALILICAGATSNIKINKLLTNITWDNKVKYAEILFQHAIDPNLRKGDVPIFFYATTIEMIELFKTYGVNIYADTHGHNVLWYTLFDNRYGPELMEYYLLEGIKPIQQHRFGIDSLLHRFANPKSSYRYTPSDPTILQKGDVLFKALPELVNKKEMTGKTPLDIAIESLQGIKSRIKKSDQEWETNCLEDVELFEKEFFALFRKYNAKTSDEIEKEAEKSNCAIF